MEIKRRTFEAKKFPKGSPMRMMLNRDPITSEYLPSQRYIVVNGSIKRSFTTKKEAEQYVETIEQEVENGVL